MELPLALREAIEAARAFARQHPQHALNPGYRQAIYAAYGPFPAEAILKDGTLDETRILTVPGNRRRALVSLLAAERVSPLWRQARPEDNMVDVLLAHTQTLLQSQGERQQAKEDALAAWRFTDEILGTRMDLPRRVSAAAFAAIAALYTTLWGVAIFGPFASLAWNDYAIRDEEMDIARWDAAVWGADAVANGRVCDEDADHTKRLAFWEWWLDEAVPQAWASVPELA